MMATVQKTYHDMFMMDGIMTAVRVILGVLLIWIAIQFGRNPHDILEAVGNTNGFMSLFVIHYIMMCHFTGGVLLILGMITRVAAAVQLPILIGALTLTIGGDGYGSIYTQFWFALVVFIMLIAVTWYGAGRYSIDEAMRDRKKI
jgi:putative oxidoreductase